MKIFLVSFSVFFLTIFMLGNFLGSQKHYEFEHDEEEIFIALKAQEAVETEDELFTAAEEQENIQEIQDNNIISFRYDPKKFKEEAEEKYARAISESLNSQIFLSKVEDLLVIFYEEDYQFRGNMKNRIIRLYDSDRIGENETFAVFLHELAHYIDLYYFRKKDNYDLSYEFYSISWLSTKITLPGQDETDFVSGYAATNAYEDFSESFLYYVLHNREFLKKAENSELLQAKYDFIKNRLFSEGEFETSNFSTTEHKNYNWDITKLEFSLENFLDYLKKSI